MNIELTKIFQQANNVGATSGGNAQVFINGQGDVSGKSGLGFFKRHFSSAARNEENFASLAAFHEAVAADPRYGAFVRDERIASFFTTKATEGTPLTAQDVREVKARLDEAHLSRIVERRSHSRDNVFSCIPPEPLVEFCMRWGFSLETNEDIRLAVTAFYDEQFTVSARKNLAESRLPEGLRTAALQIIKESPVWTATLDMAVAEARKKPIDSFSGKFKSLYGPVIKMIENLGASAPNGTELLGRLGSLAGTREEPLLTMTLEMLRDRTLPPEEAIEFLTECFAKNLNITTPEEFFTALQETKAAHISREFLTTWAESNGIDPESVIALARTSEFRARTQESCRVFCSTLPRLEGDGAMRDFYPVFLREHNRAVIGFLEEQKAFLKNLPEVGNILHEITALMEAKRPPDIPPKTFYERFLSVATPRELLVEAGRDDILAQASGNSLLAKVLTDTSLFDALIGIDPAFVSEGADSIMGWRDVLDHLLHKGPDKAFLEKLHAAMVSMQEYGKAHPGTFDGADATIDNAAKFLLTALASMNLDGAEERLLANFIRHMPPIILGVESLYAHAQRASPPPSRQVAAAERLIAAIQGLTAGLDVVTPPELRGKGALGARPFYALLDVAKNPPMPQALRDFAEDLGMPMERIPHEENRWLAESESQAFAGLPANPSMTPLLEEEIKAAANALGVPYDALVGLANPRVVREKLTATLAEAKEMLSPATAREQAREVIAAYVRALASRETSERLVMVNGLPTVPAPDDAGRISVTPAEKAALMNAAAHLPLRSADDLSSFMAESRKTAGILRVLAHPGQVTENVSLMLGKIRGVERHLEQRFPDTIASLFALEFALDSMALDKKQMGELFLTVKNSLGTLSPALTALFEETGDPECMRQVSTLTRLYGSLATRLGQPADIPRTVTDIRDIPGPVFQNIMPGLPGSSDALACYQALALVSPKLTHEEWDTLMPVMRMVRESMGREDLDALGVTGTPGLDARAIEQTLRMVAACSRELLEAARKNRGEPLTARQIWQTVIGGRMPRSVTGNNLGVKMHTLAAQRLLQVANGVAPQEDAEMLKTYLWESVSSGIPLRTLLTALRPGGHIGMEDFRLGLPSLASMHLSTDSDASILLRDWGRTRLVDSRPARVTVESGEGSSVTKERGPVAQTDQNAHNPIFRDIEGLCHKVCKGNALQTRRVLQCLSQPPLVAMFGPILGVVSLKYGGGCEGDITVTPGAFGDVVVTLANPPETRPVGLRLQMTVSPDGKVAFTDIDIAVRG